MCLTFKKNNKWTKKPVNRFLQDDVSAGLRSLQTSIEIKLCQNPSDRLYFKSALNTANSLLTLLSCLRLRVARTYLCGQPETFTLLSCNTIHNGMVLNLVLNKTAP